MNFLEKNLEDIIYNTPNEKLKERGLSISGKKLRQINIGNYGICDILTIERNFNHYFDDDERGYHNSTVKIYELKKDKIDTGVLLQCMGYAKGVSNYIAKEYDDDINVKMVLIGKEIDKNSSFIYFADFMDCLSIYTYSYDFDGIKFQRHSGYCLISEGF